MTKLCYLSAFLIEVFIIIDKIRFIHPNIFPMHKIENGVGMLDEMIAVLHKLNEEKTIHCQYYYLTKCRMGDVRMIGGREVFFNQVVKCKSLMYRFT